MEVWWKLIINCLKTSADTRGSFQETSSKLPPAQRQFRGNFLAGVLTLLTLGANFAHSGKPNFYFEVKIFTLRIAFEGKAKTGEVKIFSFGFEVNFLTCLVYWVVFRDLGFIVARSPCSLQASAEFGIQIHYRLR